VVHPAGIEVGASMPASGPVLHRSRRANGGTAYSLRGSKPGLLASMRLPLRRATLRRGQYGAFSVFALVGVLMLSLAALGAIDIGNLYLARRNLQRVADLAATAGAQTIDSVTTPAAACANAVATAQQNASRNGFAAGAGKTMTVTCGRWDPALYAAPTYFATSGAPQNAVQVAVQQQVPYFFIVGPVQTVRASAIAKATTIGSFSLATSVATLNGGLVNGLLNGLLGTSLNLSVASYQGLAGATVKISDLMAEVGVGTVDQLLNTQLTVGQLASAMIGALSRSGNGVSVTVTSALGTIAAAAPGGTAISLGNTSAASGLLSIGLSNPEAGANASIGVLDALLVAAEIANGQNAVNLGAALNLGPVANVSAQLKIVEPPVIAIGEAGQDASGNWRTSAHSAQVRLYLNVQLLNLPSLLGMSISALNLPIYIEAGQGTAYLQSTQCTTSKATSASVIGAQPGIAALCISDSASANMTNVRTPASCSTPATVAQLTLPGWPVLTISAGSSSPASGLSLSVQPASATTLVFNGVSGDSDDYQSTNSNALDGITASVLGQVATALTSSLHISVGGSSGLLGFLGVTLGAVVGGLVNLLSPVLNALDALLVPLLQLLGVQIGISTVHDIALTCGDAQLVH
jgi:uncharacterized membrane protein